MGLRNVSPTTSSVYKAVKGKNEDVVVEHLLKPEALGDTPRYATVPTSGAVLARTKGEGIDQKLVGIIRALDELFGLVVAEVGTRHTPIGRLSLVGAMREVRLATRFAGKGQPAEIIGVVGAQSLPVSRSIHHGLYVAGEEQYLHVREADDQPDQIAIRNIHPSQRAFVLARPLQMRTEYPAIAALQNEALWAPAPDQVRQVLRSS